ncbi:hypothetical protein QDR68_16075 [Acinetobacter baumannii]|uniref:hypothetical protein n=1 Tax=Acinetobacter calcoaceticus/baumannii complex TaxID=909768 RepID=UPI001112614D|nr:MULTISPECIES: hypothetical protein [Acinetobacter calcoaceticus/baumannii complex]MBR8609464.1 hypothetical protein [Acinetobacter baumannii]MDH2479161.1 hypothetical protein [Acinetobacter baumannii]
MNHYQNELKEQVTQGRKRHEIIRNFYILRPSCTFTHKYDYAEKIMEEVAAYFSIPLNCILVCGSAQLGFSLAKNTIFLPGGSDLDLAIIDSGLYVKYFDDILKITNNYNRTNLFVTNEVKLNYLNFVSKGIINPKYMPNSELKRELKNFFTSVSAKYRDYYASVSVCFYLSEYSFQRKQQSALSTWISNYQQNLFGSEK